MSFGNQPTHGNGKQKKFAPSGPIQGLGFHAAPAQLSSAPQGGAGPDRFKGAGVGVAHRSVGPLGLGAAPLGLARGPMPGAAPAFPDMRKQQRSKSSTTSFGMPAPAGLFDFKGGKLTLELKNDDVDMVDCAAMECPALPESVFLAPQLDLDSDDESMPDMEPLGAELSLSALTPPAAFAPNSRVEVNASPKAVQEALLRLMSELYDDIEPITTQQGIEGLVCVDHSPVRFEVAISATEKGSVLEVHRTAGSSNSFQAFFGALAAKTCEVFGGDSAEEHQFVDKWGSLPCFGADECSWQEEDLDLLTTLIEENEHDSVDLMASLCRDVGIHAEKLVQMVCAHKAFLKMVNDEVLTHLDIGFVRMGLVILRAAALTDPRTMNKLLQSTTLLGSVVAVLQRDSALAHKHAIRCLAAFAKCTRGSWKLNAWQKNLLDSLAILKNKLSRAQYATSGFVNDEMFAAIMEKM